MPDRMRWAALSAIAGCVMAGGAVGACLGDAPDVSTHDDAAAPDGARAESGSESDATADAARDGEPDGANDATAPWTPASLPGLALWLDGSKVEVDGSKRVTKWPDQSPNGAAALPASAPPTWVSSVAELGGRPAVRFSGTPLVVADADPLRFGTASFTLAIVARHTTPTFGDAGPYCYGFLYSKESLDLPYPGPALQLNTETCATNVVARVSYDDAITSGKSGLNDGTGHVLVMTRTVDAGAALEFGIDGVDAGALQESADGGLAQDVSAAGYDLYIGGTAAAQDIAADVAEIVAVKGPLSAADRAQLETYLESRYGL